MIIRVKMAEMKTAHAPTILQTILGSCVGLALYDPTQKIGGLAHVMLPTSTRQNGSNPAKYADTAVTHLLQEMEKQGASKVRTIAKITGGANMFQNICKITTDIGTRNTATIKKELKKHRIKLIAEDTGGNHGRNIEFHTQNGKIIIKTCNQGEKEI